MTQVSDTELEELARGDDTIPHPQVIDAERWDERWGV